MFRKKFLAAGFCLRSHIQIDFCLHKPILTLYMWKTRNFHQFFTRTHNRGHSMSVPLIIRISYLKRPLSRGSSLNYTRWPRHFFEYGRCHICKSLKKKKEINYYSCWKFKKKKLNSYLKDKISTFTECILVWRIEWSLFCEFSIKLWNVIFTRLFEIK